MGVCVVRNKMTIASRSKAYRVQVACVVPPSDRLVAIYKFAHYSGSTVSIAS